MMVKKCGSAPLMYIIHMILSHSLQVANSHLQSSILILFSLLYECVNLISNLTVLREWGYLALKALVSSTVAV
jgi:hypothetical protein